MMKRALFSSFLALGSRTILRTPAMRPTTMSARTLGRGSRVCRYSSTTSSEVQTVQDMLYRVREINHMPDDIRRNLLDFQVDGVALGKVRPAIADLLCSVDIESPVFELQEDATSTAQYLTLASSVGNSVEERTLAVARVTERLRDQGTVRGWRDELFPITGSFYDSPAFLMERAAVPLLGAIEYGVHINGITTDVTGETKIWIARRSATKSKYPGMLDHIVAGGQPAGMSLMDNVVKECKEEAGIPEAVTLAGIRAVGGISYETYQPRSDTVTRAVMFCFDLHLPPDFQPAPVDGEVQEFFLWSIDEIMQSMTKDTKDPIKPNCYAVIIDYLLRNGHVSPDTPGYLDVLRELRAGDCR
jgi:isopentenyldiphosphate isomerase